MSDTKVHLSFTKQSSKGPSFITTWDPATLQKFLVATKDATRKFYTLTDRTENEDFPCCEIYAVGISRAVTVIGKGIANADDDPEGDAMKILEDNGFVKVDSINEE